MTVRFFSVRPELVEGPFFFSTFRKGQGFDRLSPNGVKL
jgi:hypothetical protein